MGSDSKKTLAELGFRMPPEWHPHSCTYVAWPHNTDTWPENLCEAQAEFMQLVSAIAASESIFVLLPEKCFDDFFESLNEFPESISKNVTWSHNQTNDAWIRDYGPTFVIHESKDQLGAIDWHYNAWGGKYPPFDDDQKVAGQILNWWYSIAVRKSEFCVEGGALEIDERGVLMCTRSSIINPNRNPNRSVEEIETELKTQLGATHIIWLPGDTQNGPAIIGDDTDAHNDQLARFAPGKNIVHAWTEDKTDSQHDVLKENIDQLKQQITQDNLQYQLTPLPLPDPVIVGGVQLPASYCNFYITNGSVIVPQFDKPQDSRAIEILKPLFPDRKVIGLPSVNLNVGLGSFHCLTQQQPNAISN